MPCEDYKDALVEVVATGADPGDELRGHLKTCAACQAALAEEQSLFAAIDAGLHVAAKAEVPPSLFPRVRASLEREAAHRPFWSPKWYVLAGAGAMLAALFVVQALQRTRIEPKPVESANGGPVVHPHVQPPQDQMPTIAPTSSERPATQRRSSPEGNLALKGSITNRATTPEILVPGDQEVLLARYAEEWSRRKVAPLHAADDSSEPGLKPLEVAPIQIAELDVKLLAETQSQ